MKSRKSIFEFSLFLKRSREPKAREEESEFGLGFLSSYFMPYTEYDPGGRQKDKPWLGRCAVKVARVKERGTEEHEEEEEKEKKEEGGRKKESRPSGEKLSEEDEKFDCVSSRWPCFEKDAVLYASSDALDENEERGEIISRTLRPVLYFVFLCVSCWGLVFSGEKNGETGKPLVFCVFAKTGLRSSSTTCVRRDFAPLTFG